jgi:DNA-directed RNA polymerase subunit RPC12/RpoP
VDGRRWRLRFGILHVSVSEFGYQKETGEPNSNYHFHTCFFGPNLENRPTCVRCSAFVGRIDREQRGWNCPNCGVIFDILDGRLTQIFREESRKAFGVESRGVWIEKAKKGYRSALAHALKYTAKMPTTTDEGRAEYEKVLLGVRRYAVRGFLQGFPLEEKKHRSPRCPECEEPLRRIPGLGIVPLSEVADIPFLPEEKSECEDSRKDDEFCFLEADEMASHSPRAPC